jgi:hypothetical protein
LTGPRRCYNGGVINGVVVEEIWQLIIVLLIFGFVLGTIYLMQKYTGV